MTSIKWHRAWSAAILAGTTMFGSAVGAGADPAPPAYTSCTTVAGNLITNCGFETGNAGGWASVGAGVDTGSFHSGGYGVNFASYPSEDSLSQTIAAAKPGHTYTLGYWLRNRGTAAGNDFRVTISNVAGGGSQTFDQKTNAASSVFTYYQDTFVASDSAPVLTFSGRNGPGFWLIDDVAVTDNAPPLVRASVTSVSANSGPTSGGQTVIITGAHFTGATKVVFGATRAESFTVDSDTQISAVAPAHGAGVVHARVHTVGLSARTPGNRYTYVTAP